MKYNLLLEEKSTYSNIEERESNKQLNIKLAFY